MAAIALKPGGGLIVTPDPFNVAHRDLIIALAAQYGVPAIYFNRSFAESGGLMVYGSPFAEFFRQAAGYVDRILTASLKDHEVCRPPCASSRPKFEFIINLKTARALELAYRPTLLATADEVIE